MTTARVMIVTLLTGAVLAGCTGSGGQNAGETGSETAAEGTAEQDDAASFAQEEDFHPAPGTPAVLPSDKEEVVNVKADASGKPYEITVEAELSGFEGTDPVRDRSNLTEIKNREGGESFYEQEQGSLLWENLGSTIRYEGKSAKQLPVEVRVTYRLDGIEMPPAEMAGKSGEVTIRFDYENRTGPSAQRESGTDGGADSGAEAACVPFLAISAAILPDDVFSEVEVENGKVLSMGEQTIVVGYALPGLAESLELTSYEPTEEIELPEYVEIRAKADHFALDFTATIFSTGLFEEVEDEDLEDAEGIRDDVDELTDATREIADGAGELSEGAGEFGGYLEQYFAGVEALGDGAAAIGQGLDALNTQAGNLQTGADSMNKALSRISKSLAAIDTSALEEGAQSGDAAAAADAVQALGSDAAALSGMLSDVQEGLEEASSFTDSAKQFDEKVTAARETIDGLSAPEIDTEELSAALAEKYESVFQDQIRDSVEERNGEIRSANDRIGGVLDDAAAAACAAIDAQEGLDEETKNLLKEQVCSEIYDVSTPQISELSAEEMVSQVDLQIDLSSNATIQKASSEMASVLEEAKEAVSEEQTGKIDYSGMDKLSSLDGSALQETAGRMGENVQTLGKALDAIAGNTGGLTELAGGLAQLKSAVSEVQQGSSKLATGVGAFSEGIKQLTEGSDQYTQALGQAASAGSQLGSAYDALTEGLGALADGLAEFDDETSEELEKLAGDSYSGLLHRIRAVREADLSYNNFSGILEGQKGKVRFLVETDAIE